MDFEVNCECRCGCNYSFDVGLETPQPYRCGWCHQVCGEQYNYEYGSGVADPRTPHPECLGGK